MRAGPSRTHSVDEHSGCQLGRLAHVPGPRRTDEASGEFTRARHGGRGYGHRARRIERAQRDADVARHVVVRGLGQRLELLYRAQQRQAHGAHAQPSAAGRSARSPSGARLRLAARLGVAARAGARRQLGDGRARSHRAGQLRGGLHADEDVQSGRTDRRCRARRAAPTDGLCRRQRPNRAEGRAAVRVALPLATPARDRPGRVSPRRLRRRGYPRAARGARRRSHALACGRLGAGADAHFVHPELRRLGGARLSAGRCRSGLRVSGLDAAQSGGLDARGLGPPRLPHVAVLLAVVVRRPAVGRGAPGDGRCSSASGELSLWELSATTTLQPA